MPYFAVLSNNAGGWPELLSSIGLEQREPSAARIAVARAGAAVPPEWTGRVEKGAILILEGESPLAHYAAGVLPAIHIIVENGHVTLSGIVADDGDKNLAGIRARGAGLSFGDVVNNLAVERPSKKS